MPLIRPAWVRHFEDILRIIIALYLINGINFMDKFILGFLLDFMNKGERRLI